MRISDWSSDVCSSDPAWRGADRSSPTVVAVAPTRPRSHRDHRPCGRGLWHLHLDPLPGVARAEPPQVGAPVRPWRSEEHTSELQSLMRISYAVFCLKKKNKIHSNTTLHYLFI